MMDRGLSSDQPLEPGQNETWPRTYKANQISAPTAETLVAIAHTAEKFDVAVLVTELGLVLRLNKGSHSIVNSISWLDLTHANDPHGMCVVHMAQMYRAMEGFGK